MKVTDYVVEFLARKGVTAVFEMSGGMITHLLDSLGRDGRIAVVSMHHEQGAAFAADGYGRVTGRPGVAMGTSGPGATNLLTGIGSCFFDSSPGLFLTGQVNRHELRGTRPIRQLGFQETDIVSMAKPITKGAFQVLTPEAVPGALEAAFQLAVSGRPGPVLLDLPMDVQRADIVPPSSPTTPPPRPPPPPASLARALSGLRDAQRPLILVGGGIRAAGARQLLRKFAAATGTPVVASLLGLDALPTTSPLFAGFLGSYGNRWTNLAIGESDAVLVLGSRLDIRQTGADVEAWRAQRRIWHVDCDAGEINNRVEGCEPIVADAGAFLDAATLSAKALPWPSREAWLGRIAHLRTQWPDTSEIVDAKGINPNRFMRQLSGASAAAQAYVVDVGQHQMWAAQSLQLGEDQEFHTSGGMGAMGFALPAAVGVAFARPGRPIALIAGDGGFQSNIQELQTVVRNRLPIKMVVVNNRSHGMVRQFQESYFDARYQSTLWGYSAPDFSSVAQAYGIDARTVADPAGVPAALAWLWQDPMAPALLQVMVDPSVNAYPKIAFGRPMTEMEPFAKPVDMEGT